MKCVCGYEHRHGEWDPETQKVIHESDGEKFTYIKGTFLVENTGWHGGTREVSLYACPKCGTIKLVD